MKDGWTALMYASRHGQVKVVELLIEKGAEVNPANARATALMEASREGHVEVVKLLIEKGAEVNFANQYGRTSLMSASRHGRAKVVELLVEKGAEVNLANKRRMDRSYVGEPPRTGGGCETAY